MKEQIQNDDQYDVDLLKIINHYGEKLQTRKLVEEMAELIQAIMKNDTDNVLEEFADVEIMFRQMYLIMPPKNRKYIEKIKAEKIDRTLKRIEREEHHE